MATSIYNPHKSCRRSLKLPVSITAVWVNKCRWLQIFTTTRCLAGGYFSCLHTFKAWTTLATSTYSLQKLHLLTKSTGGYYSWLAYTEEKLHVSTSIYNTPKIDRCTSKFQVAIKDNYKELLVATTLTKISGAHKKYRCLSQLSREYFHLAANIYINKFAGA